MPERSIRWPPVCLPIALGEATKTVPFIMDGVPRSYRFHGPLGRGETEHRRRRGRGRRDQRPSARAEEAIIERRVCRTLPARSSRCRPQFSAVKVDGERAYDLARDGETVDLRNPRFVVCPSSGSSWSACPDDEHAVLRSRMRQGNLCPQRWRATFAARTGCTVRPRQPPCAEPAYRTVSARTK